MLVSVTVDEIALVVVPNEVVGVVLVCCDKMDLSTVVVSGELVVDSVVMLPNGV